MAELMEEYTKLKVPELKVLLKEKGLPVSGTKSDLLKRLAIALGTDNQGAAIDESIDIIDDILNDDPLTVTAKTQEIKPEPTAQAKSTTILLKPTVKPVQKTDSVAANGNAEKKDSTVTAETTEAAKPSEISKLSAEERLKLRASKFGVVATEDKKQLRAQRFGSDTNSSTLTKSESKLPEGDFEKLKKRADRFGAVVSTSLSKVDEEERKRKRAERFGTVTATETTKRPITVNSSDPDIEAKKKKRAERFGLTT